MIAKVVVENAAYSFDIAFSYQVPPAMQEDIRPGCRVLIPVLGKSNRARQGLVCRWKKGKNQNSNPSGCCLELKTTAQRRTALADRVSAQEGVLHLL